MILLYKICRSVGLFDEFFGLGDSLAEEGLVLEELEDLADFEYLEVDEHAGDLGGVAVVLD